MLKTNGGGGAIVAVGLEKMEDLEKKSGIFSEAPAVLCPLPDAPGSESFGNAFGAVLANEA